jgi:hypothetical protein
MGKGQGMTQRQQPPEGGRRKRFNIAVDVLAGLSIFSLLFYGVTGMPMWSPLGERDDLRAMILFVAHIVPLIYALLRRGIQE